MQNGPSFKEKCANITYQWFTRGETKHLSIIAVINVGYGLIGHVHYNYMTNNNSSRFFLYFMW